MNKIREYFGGFDETHVTTRGMIFYRLLAAFLGGVALGFLIAPPRRVKIGCDNGSKNRVGADTEHGCGECCCCEENGDE